MTFERAMEIAQELAQTDEMELTAVEHALVTLSRHAVASKLYEELIAE